MMPAYGKFADRLLAFPTKRRAEVALHAAHGLGLTAPRSAYVLREQMARSGC
jgi:hypothetical protein